MLQDRFQKKTKRPPSGGDSSLETVDIIDRVPQIDDVLVEIDRALKKVQQLEEQLQPRSRCGC